MAERRMFSKTIIDSDMFLDMPMTAQCLYFHLSMRADDEGFINNPKKIQRMIGASDDDLRLLIAKKFIITFDTGVVVIRHWKIHNYIQKDRCKPTIYQAERRRLVDTEGGVYELDTECIQDVYKLDTNCIQNASSLDTQYSIDKNSIGKDSIDKVSIEQDSKEKINIPSPNGSDTPVEIVNKRETKHKHGQYGHVLLTDTEYEKLTNTFGQHDTDGMIQFLDDAIEMKGYKYKNHYLVISKENNWVREEYFRKKSTKKGESWD